MEIASAFVAIRPKVDQGAFQSETTAAITKPLAKAGKEGGEAAGKGMNDALASHAKRAATTLASAFAGAQLGRKLFDSVQAASALEEQANRVAVVFGDASGSVEAFAASADQALGQSERAALQATGSFGALFTTLGLGQQEAAGMAMTLTTLASDMASFADVPIAEAITAISSGLVGESEPLRRFNVILSEAAVKQKALDLELVKSATGTLPAAAAAQARYALILEQSTVLQGDFTRTRESAANTEKRAQAETENAAASLGQNFLPIYQKATELVGTLADAFGKLPGPAQTATVALAGLAVASPLIANAATAVKAFGGAMLASTAASSGFATATRTLLAGLAPYAVMTAGVAAGVGAMVLAFDQLGQEAPDIERLSTAIDELFKSGRATGELEKMFGAGGEDLAGIVEDAGKLKAITDEGGILGGLAEIGAVAKDAFGTGATEINRAAGELAAFDQALTAAVEAGDVEKASAAFSHYFDMLAGGEGGIDAALEFTRFLPNYIAAIKATDDVAADAAGSVTALNEAFLGNRRVVLDAADAVQAVTDAQADLAEARADVAGTGERATAAAKRERDAQRALGDAYEDSADAVETLTEARAELAAFDSGPDARIRELERLQITRREIETPEEARQKEIDLLRFDEGVTDERNRLTESVADAEEGVVDAAERVSDAQEKARDATRERGDVAAEALARVEELERTVEGAVLDAVEAFEAARIAAEENGTSWGAWGVAIDDIAAKLEPGSPLRKNIEAIAAEAAASIPFIGPVASVPSAFATPNASGRRALTQAELDALDPRAVADMRAGNAPITTEEFNRLQTQGFRGPLSPEVIAFLRRLGVPGFALGGIVPGWLGEPRLIVAHGGEEVRTPAQQQSSLVVNQNNHFHGGDVPTVTQLDAQNRKLGIRIGLWGRR